jgi:putative methionine-R-sulfoxide reductase with GAF domain
VSRQEQYKALFQSLDRMLEGEGDEVALMATIASELKSRFDFMDWVGFYRVQSSELKLGPFQGASACLGFSIEEGICGECARKKQTLNVPDVRKVEHHIACSESTRSEFLVPILDSSGEVIAVLDIDSNQESAFSDIDETELPKLQRYFAAPVESRGKVASGLWSSLAIVLSVGTLLRIPLHFPGVSEEWFFPIFAPFALFLGLAAFSLIRRSAPLSFILRLGAGFLIPLLAILTLSRWSGGTSALSWTLMNLHSGFFYWTLFALAWMGPDWRRKEARSSFIRFQGEMLMYLALLMAGSMTFMGLSFSLFHVLGINLDPWVENWIQFYGLPALPLAAFYFVERMSGRKKEIAPFLARLFSPLFLLSTLAFLLTILFSDRDPFHHRQSLIALNSVLLFVTGISVYSLSEKSLPRFFALTIRVLLMVSVSLALVALAAVIFRLASWGVSPNRIAVLGANLLFLLHLSGMLLYSLRGGFEASWAWTARLLPLYAVWSLLVALLFPLIFS